MGIKRFPSQTVYNSLLLRYMQFLIVKYQENTIIFGEFVL